MQIEIPDALGWVLTERAAELGLDVGDIITVALAQATTVMTPGASATVWAKVGKMVDDGLCDADIAGALRTSPAWVAQVRRRLGKPANKRYARH